MSVVIFSHGHFNVMIYVAITYCHSNDTKKISTTNRVISTSLFGLGSKNLVNSGTVTIVGVCGKWYNNEITSFHNSVRE